MVAFKGFEPDPDITDPDDEYFGTGTWTYDDGTTAYGQGDPAEARALYKPPTADQRTAEFSAADAAEWAAEGGQQAPPPLPSAPALKANDARPDVAPVAPPPPAFGADGDTPGIRIPKTSRIAYVHNNPGNLKFAGQDGAVQGEPAEDGGHWAAFETPEEGVAALARQVELDAGRGKTVREFISKYAPPGSNDTEQYIAQAAQQLGADPNEKLSDIDRNKVLTFMAQKESSTELGPNALPPMQPSAAPPAIPGVPRTFAGMPAAVAEMRGLPLSPEQLQARQQGIHDVTMAQVAGVQNAAAERQRGRDEALALVTNQAERHKADQQSQLDLAMKAKADAQQNIDAAMKTQLDPGRIVKNMSTGDMVLGVIALALGGLGQTLQQRGGQKGAQNMVLHTLEKAFADDIEAQKEDKRSRVAHWTRIFNDSEMGIKAARAEMYNAAGKLVEAQAQGRAANADIQAQMMQDSANLIAKGQAEAQGLIDKEAERLSIRYAPPDPEKMGGVDTLAQALKVDAALEQSGYSREQRHQLLSRMGLPPPAGESAAEQKTREGKEKAAREELALTEGEGKAEAGWQTVQQYGESVGLTRDPKTGKYVADSTMDMLIAPGLKETIPGWLGKGKPIEAAREAAIDGLARLQTGAAISKEEEDRFKRLLGDESATRAQIATNLNALEALIQSRRKQSRVQPPGAPSTWK